MAGGKKKRKGYSVFALCESYATLITRVLHDLCSYFQTSTVIYAETAAIFNTPLSVMTPEGNLALLRAVLPMMKQ